MLNSNCKIRNKSVTFDAFATEYDFAATLQNQNDFFINNLSTSKGAALDIGCGSGILAFELAQYYDNVVAVDLSAKMLDIARQKRSAPNIEYIQMDASLLALDRQFDLIVSAAGDRIPAIEINTQLADVSFLYPWRFRFYRVVLHYKCSQITPIKQPNFTK